MLELVSQNENSIDHPYIDSSFKFVDRVKMDSNKTQSFIMRIEDWVKQLEEENEILIWENSTLNELLEKEILNTQFLKKQLDEKFEEVDYLKKKNS